jgi:multicopper oxidase
MGGGHVGDCWGASSFQLARRSGPEIPPGLGPQLRGVARRFRGAGARLTDGLYGAFVVEPRHRSWDVEYTEILNDGALGFTIDGKGWPATTPLTAKLGQTVLVRLANVGQMLHPLHPHGYHFTVIAQDGASVQHPYSVDRLVVAPGETYPVIVRATHAGVWALHCHILSHVEGPQGKFGMATAVSELETRPLRGLGLALGSDSAARKAARQRHPSLAGPGPRGAGE